MLKCSKCGKTAEEGLYFLNQPCLRSITGHPFLCPGRFEQIPSMDANWLVAQIEEILSQSDRTMTVVLYDPDTQETLEIQKVSKDLHNQIVLIGKRR